jgi:hypothetical protein
MADLSTLHKSDNKNNNNNKLVDSKLHISTDVLANTSLSLSFVLQT